MFIMKNRDVIEELYYSYLQKKKLAKDTIITNENRIKEIEIFLDGVKSTDTDFKIFSPLKTDDIYEGRIEAEKTELNDLLEENKIHVQLIEELDNRISQFKEILDSTSDTDEKSDSAKPDFSYETDIKNYILNITETERQRIASELHDNTIQNLVSLVHKLELCSLFIDQDPVRSKLELATCSSTLKKTVDEIREIIFNLRPMSFDDLGFKKAIEEYIDNIRVQYEIDVISEIEEIETGTDILLIVFRIIQECLINAVKHSGSNVINLIVNSSEETCFIEIQDFGKGFDIDNIEGKHFGLDLLRERVEFINGILKIDSNENGTKISIHFPLQINQDKE